MKPRDIYRMRAEADANHLLSKLNEIEAETLDEIAEHEEKIVVLRKVLEGSRTKKKKLQQKFDSLMEAKDDNWEKASNEFIEAIEALEDKTLFAAKTEEWFQSIKEVTKELRTGIKERLSL